jgi:hypothetical protein
MRKGTRRLGQGIAVSVLLGLLPGTGLAKSVKTTVMLPASFEMQVVTNGCQNHPGPTVTLGGELGLGGVEGELRFQNPPGRHSATEPVTVGIQIVEPTPPIEFAKQGSEEEGVTGNPEIWVQLLDGYGKPITDEIYLGRCVQGLDPVALLTALPALADLDVVAGSCSNHPGPEITMSGVLTLRGVDARLILRNPSATHQGDEDVELAFTIIPKNDPIVLPKQGSEPDGVTGNPEIYLVVGDDEIRLGKCVQLGS